MFKRLNALGSDARHFQIMTLSSLLCLLLFLYDFAPRLEEIALIFSASLIAQFAFTKYFNVPTYDARSPLITSLSLCLLFKGAALWLYPLAAVLAIGSKFLIRSDDKHIFNPANFGIVILLLLFPNMVWVSPGQWGSALWLGFALAVFAALVLTKARRADMALMFMAFWMAFVFGRAFWLGDPLSIPMLSIQSGALLIFAFFMISDPKSTPDHIGGRALFAFAVAFAGYIMQYHLQIREGLFFALFFISITTPLIDTFLKSNRIQWRQA